MKSPDQLGKRHPLPARSILKQTLNYSDDVSDMNINENLTTSHIQVLNKDEIFQGNNTTSKINTSTLQHKLKRRVSFAPDVTLHRFDFIPESYSAVKEPRRRNNEKIEETMEFTHPLNGTKHDQSSEKNIFHDTGFDKEVSMDITQLFSKHSSKLLKNHLEPSIGDEDMDLTGNQSTDANNLLNSTNQQINDESMDITGVIDINGSTDEKSGELMDLTDYENVNKMNDLAIRPHSNNSINTDKSTKNDELLESKNFIKDVNVLSKMSRTKKNDSMVMTDVFSGTFKSELDETMDFTDFPKSQISQINFHSPEIATSTQKDVDKEIPSKRHKLSNGTYNSYVKNSETELDANKDKEDEFDLSQIERLSPIPLQSINMQINNHMESPLTEMKHLNHTTPIPLKTFLEATGNTLFIDKNLKDIPKVVNFRFLKDVKRVSTVEIYKILYSQIPILEMNSFICNELEQRIEESQKLFNELEDQISSNPPPLLFVDYFDSNDDIKKLMDDQVSLVKSFARFGSEKVWYEWRYQHLSGIKSVLEENFTILKDEHKNIMSQLKAINDIKYKVENIRQTLLKELNLLTSEFIESNKQPKLLDRLDIERLKCELNYNNIRLDDITNLQNQEMNINLKIEATKNKINKIKLEIEDLNTKIKDSKIYNEFDHTKLAANFEVLQKVSGVKLVSLTGSCLIVELYDGLVSSSIDLAKINELSKMKVELSNTASDIEIKLLQVFINDTKKDSIDAFDFISKLYLLKPTITQLVNEFSRLQLLFPTTIIIDDHGCTKIKIRDHDLVKKIKVNYYLNILDFISIVRLGTDVHYSTKVPIKAEIVYGSDITCEKLQMRLNYVTTSLFPWLKHCEVFI